jgi:hypothetical protein
MTMSQSQITGNGGKRDPNRSPFPGMDPFLEQYWRDVHASLIVAIKNAIQGQLPLDLWAQVEQGVSIDLVDESLLAAPDVQVIEQPTEAAFESAQTSSAVATQPTTISVPRPRKDRHIIILDTSTGNRVVTAIELLSPSNKLPGRDRLAYLRKQQAYLEAGVNLVEIDLVRVGRFTLTVTEDSIPEPFQSTYRVCVRRAFNPGFADLYRVSLQDRLPIVSIPLRDKDADVLLDLQSLIHQFYVDGRYWKIDYTRDPNPAFDAADREWVDELLRASRRR